MSDQFGVGCFFLLSLSKTELKILMLRRSNCSYQIPIKKEEPPIKPDGCVAM